MPRETIKPCYSGVIQVLAHEIKIKVHKRVEFTLAIKILDKIFITPNEVL